MGRKSQQLMTGLTHEERVKRATGIRGRIRGLYNKLKRINKSPPMNYANVRRDGSVQLNPNLMGEE
jgi:hypothetical protein